MKKVDLYNYLDENTQNLSNSEITSIAKEALYQAYLKYSTRKYLKVNKDIIEYLELEVNTKDLYEYLSSNYQDFSKYQLSGIAKEALFSLYQDYSKEEYFKVNQEIVEELELEL